MTHRRCSALGASAAAGAAAAHRTFRSPARGPAGTRGLRTGRAPRPRPAAPARAVVSISGPRARAVAVHVALCRPGGERYKRPGWQARPTPLAGPVKPRGPDRHGSPPAAASPMPRASSTVRRGDPERRDRHGLDRRAKAVRRVQAAHRQAGCTGTAVLCSFRAAARTVRQPVPPVHCAATAGPARRRLGHGPSRRTRARDASTRSCQRVSVSRRSTTAVHTCVSFRSWSWA